MIEHRTGDLFASDITALAHGCNCAGAMGAGIAVQFRQRFPKMYREYKNRCLGGLFKPGDVFVWDEDPPFVVFNLGTQAHWRTTAKLDWIKASIMNMLIQAGRRGICQIGMPRIGAGLGGLAWSEVEQVLWDVAPDESPALVVYSL